MNGLLCKCYCFRPVPFIQFVTRSVAFVVNRECTGYAGKLSIETMVTTLATARGKFGTSADYLFRTEAALAEHGIRDENVIQLVHRVRARLDDRGP